MFGKTITFQSFAVNDLAAARRFYGETLGIEVEELDEGMGLLQLKLAGNAPAMV